MSIKYNPDMAVVYSSDNRTDFPVIVIDYDEKIIWYFEKEKNLTLHDNFDHLAAEYMKPKQSNQSLYCVVNKKLIKIYGHDAVSIDLSES